MWCSRGWECGWESPTSAVEKFLRGARIQAVARRAPTRGTPEYRAPVVEIGFPGLVRSRSCSAPKPYRSALAMP